MNERQRRRHLMVFEAHLFARGFRAETPKHRRVAIGDVFSYENDDGEHAHVIYPPHEWGEPHNYRTLLAFNFLLDGDELVAQEHAKCEVYEPDAAPFTLDELLTRAERSRLRGMRGVRMVIVED